MSYDDYCVLTNTAQNNLPIATAKEVYIAATTLLLLN